MLTLLSLVLTIGSIITYFIQKNKVNRFIKNTDAFSEASDKIDPRSILGSDMSAIQETLDELQFQYYKKTLRINVKLPLEISKGEFKSPTREAEFKVITNIQIDDRTIFSIVRCSFKDVDNEGKNITTHYLFKFKIRVNTEHTAIEVFSDLHDNLTDKSLRKEFSEIILNKF
jgi:hypothetical protein